MTRKLNRRFLILLATVLVGLGLFALTARPASATTYTGRYWLKVNKKACVITAYKRSGKKWVPVRAMLCSPGVASMPTRSGTYYSSMKRRWLTMTLDGKFYDYAQYTCRVYGQVYIHSVWYYAPRRNAQAVAEFNKLGRPASHGCIRVSTADAKWIYDNCAAGTRITIYSSSKPGPLGKPAPTINRSGLAQYWDPTDPLPGNPYFRMRAPKISFSKKKSHTVNYGSSFRALYGVSAKDPNSFMSLTKYVKVAQYYKYSASKKKYIGIKRFSTKSLGKYQVRYKVKDPWGASASRRFSFTVVDNRMPVMSSSYKVRTYTQGSSGAVNALLGVKASVGSTSLTNRIITKVRQPNGTVKTLNATQARAFRFTQIGTYQMTYTVSNPANPKKKITRNYMTVTIKAKDKSAPVINFSAAGVNRQVTQGTAGAADATIGVTARQSKTNITSRMTVTIKAPDGTTKTLSWTQASKYIFDQIGTYQLTYTAVNPYYQSVKTSRTTTLTVSAPAEEENENTGNTGDTGDTEDTGDTAIDAEG